MNDIATIKPKNPLNLIEQDIYFVLGLLNSHFLNRYYSIFLKSTKPIFSEIQARQVAELPIPQPSIEKIKEISQINISPAKQTKES